MLHGLHAAHEARSETGEPLGIVHRDVSPQNVLVGADGLARVLDFGIAKARGRLQTTREGQVKGKLAYMAPEQIKLGEVSRRTDVFAAGIVLWEALTGERLFTGDNEGHLMMRVVEAKVDPPSARRSGISAALDAVVVRALAREAADRFETAREMALALEAAGAIAPTSAVGRWVELTASATLEERAQRVRSIEAGPNAASMRPPPASSRDEPTRTDAAIAAAPSAGGEVTRTENHALSMEPVAPSKQSSRRGFFVAAGVAGVVGAVVAVALTLKGPAEVPAAGAPAANMTIPSSSLSPTSTSSATQPLAVQPAASASGASSGPASSPQPKAPPRSGARPTTSSPATGPKPPATATAKEAWKPDRW
jgi:serine/threonine-protein kinase